MKRIISLLSLFVAMIICLSGCHKSIPTDTESTEFEGMYSSDKETGETKETTKEEKFMGDYLKPEVLEEIRKDKIKYSFNVDSNHSTISDFYLPVIIEEYVDHNKGTFDLYRVLEDYGWQENDDFYFYIIDDMMVKFSFYESSNDNGNVIGGANYEFVYKDDVGQSYYQYFEYFPTSDFQVIFTFGSDCDYKVVGQDSLCVTYEESIVLSYIISWISVRPQTNPLNYVSHLPCNRSLGDFDLYYIDFE